ncbi:hypothetical protein D9758_008096 [Tetrapyrgos nigripes]|uniref:C2H2-type domain-containing protein n=1 Tax=Tetrapyrgos nigripes TaxID=182062 RepID=A0A8H5GH73_9AGAR|nr:hypothetical protein D9758_008096 [Tetrapyrgos nigripes]
MMSNPDYYCSFPGCDRSFPTERGLNQHYKQHGDPRPDKVQCPQESCEFAARSIIEVENHITTAHTRCVFQYYMCPVPECNFITTIAAFMTAHRREDHGIKVESPNATTATNGSSSAGGSTQSTSMSTYSSSSVRAGLSTQMDLTYSAPTETLDPIRALSSGEVGLHCVDIASGQTNLQQILWRNSEPEEEDWLQEQEPHQQDD